MDLTQVPHHQHSALWRNTIHINHLKQSDFIRSQFIVVRCAFKRQIRQTIFNKFQWNLAWRSRSCRLILACVLTTEKGQLSTSNALNV